MVDMTKNTIMKQVVETIQNNPGITARAITNYLHGVTNLSGVSSRAIALMQAGVLRREEDVVDGTKTFRYWVKDVNAKPKRIPYGTGRKAKGRKGKEARAPRVHVPQTQAVAPPKSMPAAQAPSQPMTLHRPDVSLDSMMEAMATKMANQLFARVMMKFNDAAGFDKGPSIEELRGRMPQPQEEKKHLRSVLIVGLLPAQAGQIQSEFHDCFDLRFWKDESADKLKAASHAADLVITFTSKISHWAEEIIQSTHATLIRSPGGMTRLREILTEIYSKE
jgi:hypothetical protein